MNADETAKPIAVQETAETTPKLARRLGLFDATMIVMGGIIGSGIFINSYVVARQVHTPFLILGAWVLGGLIALAGAFIYAELAGRYPDVGGQYAYLREAYHPSVAFIYGWALLLVTQTGGMAAVAVAFSHYFLEFTHAPLPEWTLAVVALALLTFINCLGVRAGSGVQNFLMVLKIVALAALVGCGLFFVKAPHGMAGPVLDRPVSFGLLAAMGAAMTPVMFAYGGWQTASFVSGEMREPRRHLAQGLLIGVIGVIVLYTAVNFVYVYVLGQGGLAATKTPASDVMRFAFGERGATLIAIGISISTLGFLSQGMLTAPRVYFAMAEDGLFFKSVAWLNPRTRVPVVAIALQGVFAVVIALSGKYEQILNYVISVDFIWFGLTAASLFVFRHRASGEVGRRQKAEGSKDKQPTAHSLLQTVSSASTGGYFRVPGHPVTTALFVIACALIVFSTIYSHLEDSWIGLLILVSGIPVYFFWRWWRRK
ncbi:MAG: basic amino acid/polyamine antiporter, family [Acidobacteriota bacterium]|jgi:APA family basic amino acid/polyamine antiporter|nr:basic amino acid/polyamine antiporter, family [Acidobacteriota bacterium]